MEKLNVAIADDNERMVQLLDEIVASDKDLQVVGTARLETDAFGHSVITGVFLQNKSPIWREATKKSIGKRIAFVFNDTVITAPLINIPLESGHFQISNPHGYDLERIFKELQKEKK